MKPYQMSPELDRAIREAVLEGLYLMVPFAKIVVPRLITDVGLLQLARQDIRKILSDNSLKDMLDSEDTKLWKGTAAAKRSKRPGRRTANRQPVDARLGAALTFTNDCETLAGIKCPIRPILDNLDIAEALKGNIVRVTTPEPVTDGPAGYPGTCCP